MTTNGSNQNRSYLWDMGYATIRELETDMGILASGKEEIYGCIFGRDSLITALQLLGTYQKSGDEYFLLLVKKILLNLAALQGSEINIESGEEPGKCIHEYRPTRHEHLTGHATEPWFLYPDNVMRNYDTVDATPLFLMAIFEYCRVAKDDEEFKKQILPHVIRAINWIFKFGDTNGDGLIDYRFQEERRFGGLKTQSWMDSGESVFHEDGTSASYPIAPVEVQAYAYVALRSWAAYFKDVEPELSEKLSRKADDLKRVFREMFLLETDSGLSLAFAIDGNGKPLVSPRSSMAHCLWAVYRNEKDDIDGILDAENVPQIVKRLMAPDLFESKAGIRTLSTLSREYDPHSYHNGSIWPHDTAIAIEGLKNYGYKKEATLVNHALMAAYDHFKTPIELLVYTDGAFQEYCSPGGQKACKKQAWSAAGMLMTADTTDDLELAVIENLTTTEMAKATTVIDEGI